MKLFPTVEFSPVVWKNKICNADKMAFLPEKVGHCLAT